MTPRIGIGALVGIVGGPATYARELVAALARRGGASYVVFTDQPQLFATDAVETVAVPLASTYHQLVWDHAALPRLVARSGVQLYHGTKNVLPWRLAVPGVVTVHDLAVYHRPETFAAPQRWHFRLTTPASVRRAVRVVADSAHARDDLVRTFHLDPARVTTVPLAVPAALQGAPPAGALARLRATHAVGERVIACVGTIQPRKHVERVIEAFVAADGVGAGWELLIAGRIRPGYAPPWLEHLPAGVRFLGPLPDDLLHALYAAAAIAMTASDYEGFGLTIAEAMANGCAVIAVGVTSVPEVVGDAGVLVPRSDAGLLAAALRPLLVDEARRQTLGTQARTRMAGFTWDATARGMRAVYDAVLAEGERR